MIEITPRDRRRFKRLLEESKSIGSLPIRTRLSDEEIARFAANRYRFPGVEINARLFRQYPQGELFSHVVGHIGRINQREVEQLEADGLVANYRGTDYIGKTGLEQSYERYLHGTTGVEEVEVDSGGRPVRTLSRTPPVSGNNLVLNLDARLQEVAYQRVRRPPRRAGRDRSRHRRRARVRLQAGLRPQSVRRRHRSPELERAQQLARPADGQPRARRHLSARLHLQAVHGARRADLRQAHARSRRSAIPGYFNFGGHVFRDDKVGGHGMVDMYKSIVVSCDTYYYMLANDLGIDAISRFMGQFGFGQPHRHRHRGRVGRRAAVAGVEDAPLQAEVVRRRDHQRRHRPGLQRLYAAAARPGDRHDRQRRRDAYRPHIVNYVEDIRTRERSPVEPRPLRTLEVKPEHLAVIKQALIGVNKEGTGARAFAGAEYVSAGKTGTAQVVALKQGEKYVESRVQERHRDHALFIAYAPADNPKIALAVVVENAGFGARAAAPIARKVLDYLPARQAARAGKAGQGRR